MWKHRNNFKRSVKVINIGVNRLYGFTYSREHNDFLLVFLVSLVRQDFMRVKILCYFRDTQTDR